MAKEISTAQLADNAVTTAKILNANVTGGKMSIQPVGDIGRAPIGYVRFAAATDVADTVTVGAGAAWTAAAAADHQNRVYDRSGATAAACATAFAAMVNDALFPDAYSAVVLPAGGDTVALVPDLFGVINPALAESTGSARTVISGAAMTGVTAPADRSLCYGEYTIMAADVTSMAPAPGANQEIPIAGIPSLVAPTLVSFGIRDANGVHKSNATIGARLVQAGAGFYVLAVQEGGAGPAVLAATDVVNFIVAVTA